MNLDSRLQSKRHFSAFTAHPYSIFTPSKCENPGNPNSKLFVNQNIPQGVNTSVNLRSNSIFAYQSDDNYSNLFSDENNHQNSVFSDKDNSNYLSHDRSPKYHFMCKSNLKSEDSSLSISSDLEKNLNLMVMEDNSTNHSTLKSNLQKVEPRVNWMGQDCKKANNEKKIFIPPVRHSNSDIVKRESNTNTKRSVSSGSEKYDEVDESNFSLTNNQNKRFSAQSLDDGMFNHFSTNPNDRKQMYLFGNHPYLTSNLDNDCFNRSNQSIENLSNKSNSNISNSPNKSYNNFKKAHISKNTKNNMTAYLNSQSNQGTPIYFSPNKQTTMNENYNRMITTNMNNGVCQPTIPYDNNGYQNLRHFSQPVNLFYTNNNFLNQNSPIQGPIPNPQVKFQQVKGNSNSNNNKVKSPYVQLQGQHRLSMGELNTNKQNIDNIQSFQMNMNMNQMPITMPMQNQNGNLLNNYNGSNYYDDTFVLENILNLLKDQNGCRLVQKKIEEKAMDRNYLDQIYEKIKSNINEIITDQFGNYVIQKYFEIIQNEKLQVLKFFEKIKNELFSISVNPYGTRFFQKALECMTPKYSFIETDELNEILKELLKNNIINLILDTNGNHVFQKILILYPKDKNDFIYDELTKFAFNVAKLKQGGCIFQRAFDYANLDQKKKLVFEIFHHIDSLINDEYGNFIIQQIVFLKVPEFSDFILAYLKHNLFEFAKKKFSSNVIDKCILIDDPLNQNKLRNELINFIIEKRLIGELICDQFGNYVIQKALQVSEPNNFMILILEIKNVAKILKQTSSGRKIYDNLQQQYGEFFKTNNANMKNPNKNITDARRNSYMNFLLQYK